MCARKRLSKSARPGQLEFTRRDALRVGSLALSGLTLGRLLSAEAEQTTPTRRQPAKSCIFLFLEGGPSHIDIWDMKPDAPDDVRGEFQPIQTTVPGVQICEHLPMLAQQMHNVALIRSVHHNIVDHNAGAYYTLTGRSPLQGSQLIVSPGADDFPPYGSVLKHLRRTRVGNSFGWP